MKVPEVLRVNSLGARRSTRTVDGDDPGGVLLSLAQGPSPPTEARWILSFSHTVVTEVVGGDHRCAADLDWFLKGHVVSVVSKDRDVLEPMDGALEPSVAVRDD